MRDVNSPYFEEQIIKDLSQNNLSFKEFKAYYNDVKKAIKEKKVKNPLKLLLMLANASVFISYEIENQELKSIYSDLCLQIINRGGNANTLVKAFSDRKVLQDWDWNNIILDYAEKFDFEKYFDNMKNKIRSGIITFKDFSQFYNVFNALKNSNASIENINLVEIAEILSIASVEQQTSEMSSTVSKYRDNLQNYINENKTKPSGRK